MRHLCYYWPGLFSDIALGPDLHRDTESFAAAPFSGFYTPSLNMSINTKVNKGVFEVLGVPMPSNLQSSMFHA